MLKPLTLFLLLLAAAPARAQTSGCPDTRATNYNPAAAANDGSCQYATTSTSLVTKAALPAALAESSGLQLTSQGLWSFNDSGNGPVLFRLDSASGAIQQQVTISNFPNVDWEDLAADARHLYVGDFGNNNGDRRDLRVLRVLAADIGPSATETVTAQAIHFSYPDQTNFSPGLNNHNFDCEAFFYAHDSLHLFTKNWADLRTNYYTVPAQPGTYVAHFKGSFNVNGLITAAALNPAGTGAGLLGYNAGTGTTFLWLLADFPGGQFLRGNKRRIELSNAVFIGQAEGLAFAGNYRVLLSNERVVRSFITIPQRLYALNTGRWLAPPTLPDLVVSGPQAIQGSYRNVTITGPTTGGPGVATLAGGLLVAGTLTVQDGAVLDTSCQPLTGPGSFELQAGGELRICDADGIASTGATGAVQVAGTRRFSPDASYIYTGTAAQTTGPGLPGHVRKLTVE